MTTTIYTARWDNDQQLYVQSDLGVWSEDGNNWHDDHGGHCCSPEFEAATITLAGGPHDGETVY
jgi:hypothetical protein